MKQLSCHVSDVPRIPSTRLYIHQELRKEFGDKIPPVIVHASFTLTLQLLPCDVAGACALDPLRCAWALCFRRMYKDSRFVMFWKSVIYAHMNGPGGWGIYKFGVPTPMRRIIEAVDRGDEVVAIGQCFSFGPLARSSRPRVRRSRDRDYNVERRRLINLRFTLRRKEIEAARAAKRSNTPLNRKLLAAASERLTTFQKKHPGRKRRPATFDLTTRNGAKGNYKFQAAV